LIILPARRSIRSAADGVAAVGPDFLHLPERHPRIANKILVNNLSIRDDVVLSGVVKALGWIGDQRAFEAISRLSGTAGERAATGARFASTLIAHRLGLDGGESSNDVNVDYLDLQHDAARRLSLDSADPKEAEMCLRSVVEHPYGIEYAEAPMYQLRCGQNAWMVLFNRDCVGRDVVERLRRHKSLLSVIAYRSRASRLYAPVYLVMTAPSGGGVAILVYRASGGMQFGGETRIDDGIASFSMRAAARPGAFAVRLDGTFDGVRLTMSTALAGAVAARRKRSVVEA
jgi:hypothetical protein